MLTFMGDGIKDGRRQGRHDLHGGGVPARLRDRQGDAPAQLAVRLRARQEGRRSTSSASRPSRVRKAARAPACSAATTSASRRTRRTPRARSLHRVRDGAGSRSSRPSRRCRRRPRDVRRPGGQEGVPFADRAEDGGRAGASRGRCRRSTRRSRGDLQQRLRRAVRATSPKTRTKKMNDEIDKALADVLDQAWKPQRQTGAARRKRGKRYGARSGGSPRYCSRRRMMSSRSSRRIRSGTRSGCR